MVRALSKINASMTSSSTQKAVGSSEESFKEVLDGINLSKHALKRLMQRGIPFDKQIANSLSKGIDEAMRKGGREALLMLNDSAYIVGVPKRQLITAFKLDEMSKVVTNIDTAVILGSGNEEQP